MLLCCRRSPGRTKHAGGGDDGLVSAATVPRRSRVEEQLAEVIITIVDEIGAQGYMAVNNGSGKRRHRHAGAMSMCASADPRTASRM